MTRPTTRSHHILAFVLALALVGGACSRGSAGPDPEPPAAEDRIISNVWRTDSPTQIEVGWFATQCEKFDSIDVTETSERVGLKLKAFVDSDACAEPGTVIIPVELDTALGDRLVYDDNPFIENTVLVEAAR